jgi:cytochrome P450
MFGVDIWGDPNSIRACHQSKLWVVGRLREVPVAGDTPRGIAHEPGIDRSQERAPVLGSTGRGESRQSESLTVSRAPRALPLVGHGLQLLLRPLQFLTSLSACGDMAEILLGSHRAYVLCRADLVHQVLVDDRTFDKGGPFYDSIRQLAGNGLATCPYSQHRRQRRLVQPAFHSSRLAGYATLMAETAAQGIAAWRDGNVIDVLSEMYAVTTRVVVRSLFGAEFSVAAAAEARHDMNVVVSRLYKRMLTPAPLRRLVGSSGLERAMARLRVTTARIIDEYRRNGIDHGDVLSMLLAVRDDRGDELADPEISDQVLTFFLAGSETTAASLAWALQLIATRPDIEQRLHAEVDAVLGGRLASLDDLPRLELTRRVITETLRLYPPVWLFSRTTTIDTALGGYPVPAGTTVIYSPYFIHRMADLYPSPDRFEPDRWRDARMEQASRGAYVPFGGGPRKCIGDTFSMTIGAVVLASVVARWRLSPVAGAQASPRPQLTLVPKALKMRTTRR